VRFPALPVRLGPPDLPAGRENSPNTADILAVCVIRWNVGAILREGIAPEWSLFFSNRRKFTMTARVRVPLIVLAGLAFASAGLRADVESGPKDRIGGAFNVKAFTGDNKGKTLCYV
jgi:hypothetical protein